MSRPAPGSRPPSSRPRSSPPPLGPPRPLGPPQPLAPPPRDDARLLARLRASRVAPARDLTLAAQMAAQAKDLRKRARSFGALGAAWLDVVPAALRERATLISFARGVLLVRADDDAARFELDRWLRTGGEVSLVKRCPTALLRVRLT